MKKRILSCLTALALCLTLLPATAQAAEGESVTEPHTHSDWLASGYGTDGKTLVLRAGGDDNIYGDTLEKPNDGDWILPAGNYYLQDDITVEYAIAISGDVTICLNSKTIQSTGGDAVFRVTGSGKLTLTDCNGNAGKVKSTREGSGSGVKVENGGTFNMYGGTISGNTTTQQGGGVYVYGGNSKFNMYGGTISGNTADLTDGGVFVNKSGKFEMNGGKTSVSGNTATTNGGGVYVEGGTFTMNNGTIGGGKDDANTANQGGGVYASSGTFTMNDGRITGNHNNGVFVHDSATFTVSRTPTVTGNTNTTNSAASNVYLMGSAYITIGEFGLTDGASIGVTKVVDPRTEKAVIATNVSTDCSGKFFSDDETREVKYDTDKKQLVLKKKETPPPTHTHIWTYTANGATIKATCTGEGVCDFNKNGGSVTIKEPANLTYDGNRKTAEVTYNNWKDSKVSEITYYRFADDGSDTYTSMKGGIPTEVGKYKASITVGGKTAFVEYEVTGSTTEIVPVSQITLKKTSTSISVGNSEKLTATVTPENAANKDLKWASSDTSVATVAADGTVTAKAPGTAEITATAVDGSGKSATCTVTVTGGTTPSQPGGSTGGSSSGGGGGSSSDRDSSDSNPVIKTETKNNADGSTTKTETRRDGSVTQTTTAKDGSVSKTETKKDGSSVTENKAADGSTGTVKTDKHGQTEANAKVSAKAVEDAKKSGEPVKAPVEVEAARNSNAAPTVKVELPKGAGETKVEIPVSNVKSGTVAVLVHPDGTEEIVKNSVPTENGIQLTVDGSATVKIVDNSKGFIDIRDHWAKDAIDFVSARGLVNGMTDTIYAPNNSTTRAQLWTILARQNDAELTGGATWYEKAQNWAKDKGVSDGANPNAAINRAQMVTMLWRAVGQPTAGSAANFTDVSADSYYAGAVSWAVENGITTGVGGGRFDPAATCTRAQIAAFLTRLYAEK